MKKITVNFYSKNQENYVNYHNFSSVTINNNVNFPMKITVEEVMNLPKKEKKKYKKIAMSFLATVAAFPTLASKSMAATLQNTPSQTSLGLLIPPDFLQTSLMIIISLVLVAVVFAIACMIGAGVMRMIKQRKFAIEWTTDIIHGFAHVLVSAPTILFIFFLMLSLFKYLLSLSGVL